MILVVSFFSTSDSFLLGEHHTHNQEVCISSDLQTTSSSSSPIKKKKELLTEYKIDFNIADKRTIVFTQNKFTGAVCWLFT